PVRVFHERRPPAVPATARCAGRRNTKTGQPGDLPGSTRGVRGRRRLRAPPLAAPPARSVRFAGAHSACGKAGRRRTRKMKPETTAHRRPRPRAANARARMSTSLSLLVTLAGLAPLATPAQEAPARRLPPVVVSASGFAQSLADAIPHTTVHTREDIAGSGHTDL